MPVCSATLAVDRPVSRNSQDGGNDRQADFIRITLFGKQAETFSRYLTKGRQVAVEGRIQTGSYQNQKGDTVYTTDVIVNRFEFIGSKSDSQAGGSGYSASNYGRKQQRRVRRIWKPAEHRSSSAGSAGAVWLFRKALKPLTTTTFHSKERRQRSMEKRRGGMREERSASSVYRRHRTVQLLSIIKMSIHSKNM